MSSKSILIVDEQPIIYEAIEGHLRRLLSRKESRERLPVVKTLHTLRGLNIDDYEACPKLIILEVFAKENGLGFLQELKSKDFNPEIIVFTQSRDAGINVSLEEFGIHRICYKTESTQLLVQKIKQALVRLNIISEVEAEAVIPCEQLTPKEIEITNLVAMGYSNKEIGIKQNCSEFTVKTHKQNIMKKTGVKNLAELIRWFYTAL